MAATKNYRITRGKISRPEADGTRKVYKVDDIIAMTKPEARYHKDRIQLYTGPVVSDDDEDEDEDEIDTATNTTDTRSVEVDWTSALSSMSASDAIKTIAQLDSVAEVANVKSAEQSMPKPRRSVLEAADVRMGELTS